MTHLGEAVSTLWADGEAEVAVDRAQSWCRRCYPLNAYSQLCAGLFPFHTYSENVSYESLPGADSVDPMQTVREADPGDIRRLIAWVWKRTSVAVS
jgi:hypothetical protein